MSSVRAVAVGRRRARGIVIDDEGRLLVIKRTKPGQEPYWTLPGGGVDGCDATVEDALRRELAEELGATADIIWQVFLSSDPHRRGRRHPALLPRPADVAEPGRAVRAGIRPARARLL